MAAPALRRLSYAEYLALEHSTGIKHEYQDGAAVAMAGGSIAHADLGGNVYAALAAALRGGPCRPCNSDQKIRVPGIDFVSYPDVAVFCGPRIPDALDRHALTNPTVLVEVLSPSTEGYDRGEKFRYYQNIPSLRQYVLVSTTAIAVDVFTRNPDDSWTLRGFGPGETMSLGSLGIQIPVDTIYDAVELDARERLTGRG